jgi:HPt (histidine-containing phosphotransfer) domain-containing protein
MTTAQNSQFFVGQLIRVTAKEARYLERTADRLRALNIDLSWVESLENSDEYSEMLDAFVSRYGRLQDTLGDKLLPALLRAGLEKTGAEKLGWIESTQAWVELRELRNRLVHEYMESADDLLDALQQALQGVHVLTETHCRMAAYAQHFSGGNDHAPKL